MTTHGKPTILKISRRKLLKIAGAGGAAVLGSSLSAPYVMGQGKPVFIRYMYPVGVSGPLAKEMADMVQAFNDAHPNIVVEHVYTGDYDPTEQKILTAIHAGNPPDVFLTILSAMRSFLALDALLDITDWAKKDGIYDDFHPALLGTAMDKGRLYGLPFQSSTAMLYWNKDAFKEAGLDPEKAPSTWDEMHEYSKKLTKRSGNDAERWGVTIGGGWHDWLFESFVRQNGYVFWQPDKVAFNAPQAVEALELWSALANKDRVMPRHSTWGSSSADFVAGRTAMLYHTTGIMTFVKNSAKFPFGAAFMPKKTQYGSVIGGGPLWISKKIPDERKRAAYTFANWMTSTKNTTRWGLATGYVPARKSAWELPEVKKYLQETPGMRTAWDQLEYAGAFLQVPQYQKVREILKSSLDSVLDDKAKPKEALDKATEMANAEIARVSKRRS